LLKHIVIVTATWRGFEKLIDAHPGSRVYRQTVGSNCSNTS